MSAEISDLINRIPPVVFSPFPSLFLSLCAALSPSLCVSPSSSQMRLGLVALTAMRIKCAQTCRNIDGIVVETLYETSLTFVLKVLPCRRYRILNIIHVIYIVSFVYFIVSRDHAVPISFGFFFSVTGK